MDEANYRHEWKHIINNADKIAIRQRLRAVAQVDANAAGGRYLIRREKFRIRYYNGNTDQIHLEKKSKWNGLGTKDRVLITADEAQRIVEGDLSWMMESQRPLVQELYVKMNSQGLRPKTIVDYTREPFVYAPGNVRVTLDDHIRTGLLCTDFLNPDCITIPAGAGETILEVKWDAYLPAVIRDAVQLGSRQLSAFSKYATCRMYG